MVYDVNISLLPVALRHQMKKIEKL